MGEPASNESAVILLVDDDPDVLTSARVLLTRNGYRVLSAASPAEAWGVLAAQPVDVILLDLNFSRGATSGEEGFRWLADLHAQDPEAVVVVVTGHSGINIAVAAMKAGASDFVMKPWSNARLLDTVRDAAQLRARRRQGEGPPLDEEALLIGDSPAIRRLRDLINRAAPTGAAVMVEGPPGSGKTLAARILHARSGRGGALVRLDARDLAPETAATVLRGAFRDAAGGSLLIEEAGALPGPAQTALLALLDDGGDVRLISTARTPPEALREEVRARLGTVELRLPPLGERGDDLLLLAEHFLRLFARRYGKPPMPLDASAVAELKAHPPADGVRGLRQACERAVVLGQGGVLSAADFAADPAPAGSPAADLNLSRTEKAAVEAALKRHAHNVSRAARELGLTRAALYRRMEKHGL